MARILKQTCEAIAHRIQVKLKLQENVELKDFQIVSAKKSSKSYYEFITNYEIDGKPLLFRNVGGSELEGYYSIGTPEELNNLDHDVIEKLVDLAVNRLGGLIRRNELRLKVARELRESRLISQ